MPVTKAQVKQTALQFPGANEKPSYGKPAFFIEKKFFTRVREEDNSIVMIVSGMEQRDMMLELDPETYFITEHYRDFPSVLVRLSKIAPGELKTMLRRRWEQIAPRKMLKEIGEKKSTKPAKKRVVAKTKKAKKKKR